LSHVLRIFTDTVAAWYRQRFLERGLPEIGDVGLDGDRAPSALQVAATRAWLRIETIDRAG
jgi:hypothetical protein